MRASHYITFHVGLALVLAASPACSSAAPQAANPAHQARSPTTTTADAAPAAVPAIDGAVQEAAPPFDPGAVMAKVRGEYKRGIHACHRRLLKIDPSSQGAVKIEFTIFGTGQVADAKITSFDTAMVPCIEKRVLEWTFTPILPGETRELRLQVTLQLTAG